MIEKWVIFKRDYLEISFLRENCGYDGSDERRRNGSLLYGSDTAKQEFFMRLQLRLQSLHKHDFISNQLLFYCWLTQHFNFSVSFSFKLHTMCGVFEEVCKRIDTFKW